MKISKIFLSGFMLAVLAMLVAHPPACAATSAALSVSVNESTGLPMLGVGGKQAMHSDFLFWGRNWKWAGMEGKLQTIAPMSYRLEGKSKPLDLDLQGKIEKTTDRKLIWALDFDAHSASSDVVGGGIAFTFDLTDFATELGAPELLPNGWAWGRQGGSRIEMHFDPKPVALYFEKGNKNDLRVFFYQGDIPKGPRHFKATLAISDDIAFKPTQGERFGSANMAAWSHDLLDWNRAPVDLSFLNEQPAGKRGFVQASGEQLRFADGSQARFWGTNLTAAALFGTPKEAVKQQARRLSQLGFNLVRFHHHDSFWVNPNVFGKDASNTRTLSLESLDKLDWWIKCLKDEGIYVWLDLNAQRAYQTGDDIYGFDEIAHGKDKAELKGYNYVNLTMRQEMKRFNEAYLNHVDAYTGIAYKDEPAIMGLLITNENDITNHFGNNFLPDKNVPLHNRLFMSEAKAFAKEHGLPENMTWRSWEAGPSKLFLNDLERRFDVDMIGELRALGVKVPIATTNSWGNDTLFSLPALTAGSVVDVHSYGGALEMEKNPLVAANMVDWMAAGQVVGKPMTVTEWNVEKFPVPDRHDIPLYVAANASHQGWDAMMQYAYAQIPLSSAGYPSNWHAYNDPALIATLPAAALLYRQGHVREASTTYVYQPSKEQLFYQATTPDNSVALRTATERGKLLIAMPKVPELPWLQASSIPKGAKVIHDPNLSLIAAGATEAVSDTGELRRNWAKGIYTINTPRTQAAMGWIGGERIVLTDVEIDAHTKNATIAVQSLDGAAIEKSHDLLISLGARSVPGAGNGMPFRSEPVEGLLTIRAPKGLRLYKNGALQQKKEVPAIYKDGRYVVNLDRSVGTFWLFLRAK